MTALALSNDLATSGAVLFLIALVVILVVAWLLSRSTQQVPPAEPIAEYARSQVPAEEEEHHPAETVETTAVEDDLKKIEGIGPKMEAVLKQAGITTFARLAETSVEELQRILDEAGVARITNPQTWPEQARLAAVGDWEGLEKLQNELKGGLRRP